MDANSLDDDSWRLVVDALPLPCAVSTAVAVRFLPDDARRDVLARAALAYLAVDKRVEIATLDQLKQWHFAHRLRVPRTTPMEVEVSHEAPKPPYPSTATSDWAAQLPRHISFDAFTFGDFKDQLTVALVRAHCRAVPHLGQPYPGPHTPGAHTAHPGRHACARLLAGARVYVGEQSIALTRGLTVHGLMLDPDVTVRVEICADTIEGMYLHAMRRAAEVEAERAQSERAAARAARKAEKAAEGAAVHAGRHMRSRS